jgi:hypothetical protein
MDADRFDALARSLIGTGSRRHALVLALSGVLTVLLAREHAAAHDLFKKCKKKSGKQKKACVKKAKKHAAQHTDESPTCETGFTRCGDACVNTQNDPQQCGRCGVRCPGSATGRCAAGKCTQIFGSLQGANGGVYDYTVPGTGTLTVEALGAGGNNGGRGANIPLTSGGDRGAGGRGGKVTASFPVAAGEVFQITVGGWGRFGLSGDGVNTGAGGDGGDGGPGGAFGESGDKGANRAIGNTTAGGGGGGSGGGGTSEVRQAGSPPEIPPIIQAGGGGGGGGGGGAGSGGGNGGAGGFGGGFLSGSDVPGAVANGENGVSGGPGDDGGGAGGAGGPSGYGFGPDGAALVFGGGRDTDGQVTVTFTVS